MTALGTLTLRVMDGDPYWEIAAPAYVLMWVRRLNPKADRFRAVGKLHVSATVDRTADLEWICVRYPLELADDESRAAWDRMTGIARKRADAIRDVFGAGYVPRSFELSYPPREYQRLAADLFLRTGHLLLVDDVGLGKTVTAIAALSDETTRPALVVTLTHLTRQWQREFARFAPGLRVHVLKKATAYDLRGTHGWPDVVIGNYHKLAGWEGTLTDRVRTVVFDEVQELRRDASAKYSAARSIAHAADRRLGLSATPVYNFGSEVFNIIDVLAPGMLGNLPEFKTEWCTSGGGRDSTPVADPVALGSYLRAQGAMLVRTRRDVGRELPELSSVVQAVDTDTDTIDAAIDSVTELARVLTSGADLSQQQRFAASTEIDWKLREATGVAKAPAVADFVRLLCEAGERVLLFGWHHAVYDIWMERLADLDPARFTGEESVAAKEASAKAFIHGRAQVLIMSLRAGAGIDGLQHRCRTVVNGELDWSPAVHEQGAGRIHRDGQRDPVFAYYCLSNAGSDPVIADALGLKEAQSRGVRGLIEVDGGPQRPLFGAPAAEVPHVQRLARMVLEKRSGTAKRP